ncbi:single-stranded DNA-binding protein [Microbacterium sp.]|uniref:single-stranded DNA-binding protein n=1 Tax=Microbacterium sp. TaxID=51671 RepID=UPI0026061579|nr:single-stranded DNA-binding protein [Microbacterium sp.]
MSDTVTILGRVGGDPNRSETAGGVPIVKFRVASPQRRFDNQTQQWVETGTNWYNVSAFRQLADHAKASLRQGEGVIVTGRLKLREWESGDRKGMSADIDAEAIGHDLRWGASAFIKANRLPAGQGAEINAAAFASNDTAEVDVPDDASDIVGDTDTVADEASDAVGSSDVWTASI